MSIELKRIYLENYKLFTSKAIEFENYLSVFDGPNGYGKTSIFDAIEFLITGSISRIKENQTISGTLGYSSNFLAKEQTKDVIIKGEFINKETLDAFIIALIIPTGLGINSRKNNPKSIDTQVETYFLPNYDIPTENWSKYKVDLNIANNKRKSFFGVQNLEFFTMLHYIRQEDRLSYFKKSESDRTAAIENLFGIQDYTVKATQIDYAYKQLRQKMHSLNNEIDLLSKEIQKIPQEATQTITYVPLSDLKPRWDQENLGFRGPKSSALHEQLQSQLDGIKALFLHREEFNLALDLKEFFEIIDNQKIFAILAWKILSENSDIVTKLQEQKMLLDFLHTQKEQIDNEKFVNVNWEQLCPTLKLPNLVDQFTNLVTQIRNASANRTDLQKSLSALKQAREKLHNEKNASTIFKDGQCPYCGQDWENSTELEEHFSKTQVLIDAVLGREYVEYTFAIEQCKDLFKNYCEHHFDSMIFTLENDLMLQVFVQFPNWQAFQNSATKCVPIMKRLGVNSKQIELRNSLQDSTKHAFRVLERIIKLKESISADYYDLNQRYNFYELYCSSFRETRMFESLSLESLDKKKEYIANQYYHSFDKSLDKLYTLKEQRDSLNDLCEQMKSYATAIKNAIKSYQQLVIGQIEIPFFLYSSRLLQSYQGGQGVLIKSDGKSVRFTALGFEHDVLYTMSSGQLSAVLLAFSLALNKIYAGNSFQTIMIDDPIQCMDDINMISFVELLRGEFSQSQIILSTHEDTFSNYICYKFQKYGLSQQTITLKNS